jgi:hypothetical protein
VSNHTLQGTHILEAEGRQKVKTEMRQLRIRLGANRVRFAFLHRTNRGSLAALGTVLATLALAALLPAGAGAAVPELLWQTPEDGKSGSGAGQVRIPKGVAVDPDNGHLFVVDGGNARIDEFDAWGQFVKAWGWGVVASGPDNAAPINERQSLTVDATAGAYRLNYLNTLGNGDSYQQKTAPIAANASAATVEAALVGLESLEAGDVAVSGGPGDAGGTAPYTIEFTGDYADSDVPELQILEPSLSGGGAKASVETLQGGGSFEICKPQQGDVCQAGQSGGALAGQLFGAFGIALDSVGDVYVSEVNTGGFGEEKNFRVQKFDSEGNFLLMWGGEVNKTSGANICTKADLEAGDRCGSGTPGTGDGQFQFPGFNGEANKIAAGPSGTIFVGDVGRIQEFSASGVFVGDVEVPGETIRSLAMNGKGEFYVTFVGRPGIRKLSASGVLLRTFADKEPGALNVGALAVSGADELYAVSSLVNDNNGTQRIVKFDADGNVTIGSEQHFAEYFSLGLATSSACGIEGEDLYSAGLIDGGSFIRAYGPPPDPAICPPPSVPPTIADQFATSVDPNGATVRAKINPHFWPDTTYYVQYGTGECSKDECTQSQPAAPGSLLSEKTVNFPFDTAGVFLSGLQPATTYHYRFVAVSGGGGPVRGVGGTPSTDGSEGTFTTFRLPSKPNADCPNQVFRGGASAILPDCRAYEMVSPLDKNNGDIVTSIVDPVPGSHPTLNQSSLDGEKLTYGTYRSFGDSQSAPFTSAYIASRSAQGWSSSGISPPRGANLIEPGLITDTQFKAFSPDLCSGWVFQESDALLASGAVKGYANLYQRQNCGAEAGTYRTLTTAKPPNIEVKGYRPELQGVSADGSHAIFRVRDSLTGNPYLGPEEVLLYEAFGAGKLRLVCVLPDGTPLSTGCSAGTASTTADNGRRYSVSNAISDDGSRIFWADTDEGQVVGGTSRNKLYVRINGKQTVAVSAQAEALSGHEGARYWTAAADGSKAIFSVGQKEGGSDDLYNGEADLYEFELGSETTTLISHGLFGIMGASEDAQRIYLVSKEALDDGATAGKPNLYLYEAGGGFTFIATLSSDDALDSLSVAFSPISSEPSKHTAQVSADGLHAVFMSTASLTGFDNTDLNSGRPDAEVYRYDAASGALDCVSCNPTGARPTGRVLGGIGDVKHWAAARIPTTQTQLYPVPRVLSADGGRVFFQSFEALVAADTNGVQDVYQWEALGKGDCSEASETFSQTAGGCVSLISSGESSSPSTIVEASESGSDVFFATAESLLGQDPGLIDIYDARVGGGLPPPPSPPPACEGEACQGPLVPPDDPTPASSAFEGAGNVVNKPPRARCTKNKVARKGRCVAKKRKHRAKHERRAGR